MKVVFTVEDLYWPDHGQTILENKKRCHNRGMDYLKGSRKV